MCSIYVCVRPRQVCVTCPLITRASCSCKSFVRHASCCCCCSLPPPALHFVCVCVCFVLKIYCHLRSLIAMLVVINTYVCPFDYSFLSGALMALVFVHGTRYSVLAADRLMLHHWLLPSAAVIPKTNSSINKQASHVIHVIPSMEMSKANKTKTNKEVQPALILAVVQQQARRTAQRILTVTA